MYDEENEKIYFYISFTLRRFLGLVSSVCGGFFVKRTFCWCLRLTVRPEIYHLPKILRKPPEKYHSKKCVVCQKKRKFKVCKDDFT